MIIRAATDADYPKLAELQSAHYLHHWAYTAEGLERVDSAQRAQYGPLAGRLSAEEEGEIAAGLSFAPVDGLPGTLRFQLSGVPAAYLPLYADLLARVAPYRQRSLQSVTREDLADMPFLSAAGFQNRWQSWGAHLDLSVFDFTPYQALEERLFLDGFEVEDVTGRQDGPLGHALYALFLAVRADTPYNPTTTHVASSYAQFREDVLGGRVFAALRKGELAGYTALSARKGEVESGHTAVAAPHRGRGLATLLKARALAWAKGEGYLEAGTGGTVMNLPMLRVNQKLGYAVSPMWVTWAREL